MRLARPRRWPRWTLYVLGALLLWLGALAWLQVEQRRRALSTGDPLLDRYLALAEGGVLEPDEIALLESEFPADPRQWELQLSQEPLHSLSLERVEGLVQRARANDALSAPLLMAYIKALEAEWKEAVPREQLDALFIGPLPTRGHPEARKSRAARNAARQLYLWRTIDADHGERRRQLYDELVALAPEDAEAYYLRAWMRLSLGEYEEAIADVERGNAAPHDSVLALYPRRVYAAALDEGNVDLAAAMPSNTWFVSTSFVGRKQFHSEMWSHATASGDREAMQALHVYACRKPRTAGRELLDCLTAIILIGMECQEPGVVLQPGSPESQAIGLLTQLRSNVKNDTSQLSRNSHSQLGTPPTGPLSELYARLDNLFPRRYVKSMLREEIRVQREIRSKILPQFELIEQFDWQTMSWPNELQAGNAVEEQSQTD